MTVKFNYMTIFVRDLERSCAFYEQLAGLQVLRRITPPGGQIAFLGNAPGETMLELVAFAQGEKVETRGLTVSFLAGEDLETLRRRAADLGYAPSEIVSHPPKPDHFTVADPDGIAVEFSR